MPHRHEDSPRITNALEIYWNAVIDPDRLRNNAGWRGKSFCPHQGVRFDI